MAVYGWPQCIVNNLERVKVNGLYAVLVRRRLDIISSILAPGDLSLRVEWIPSQQNKADCLTRIPDVFVQCWKSRQAGKSLGNSVVVAAAASKEPGLLTIADVKRYQDDDNIIQDAISCKLAGKPIECTQLRKVETQLHVVDQVLMRSIKLPLGDVVSVLVIPEAMQNSVVARVHHVTGHANWEAMHQALQSECYFPNMSSQCQQFVRECAACVAANATRGEAVPPSRAVMPSRPWQVVQIDTLELGMSRNHDCHCVLVCADVFTKYAVVRPLSRHDGFSVASALVDVCSVWGPPEVIRCDSGTELYNTITKSLYDAFGIAVRRGAVRHPQSQGAAERFNRTLLTLIRKALDESDDWPSELQLLMSYYNMRPNSVTGLSPFEAMVGRQPVPLVVQRHLPQYTMSAWVDRLQSRSARVRDYLQSVFAEHDFIEPDVPCPYVVGEPVMLRRPDRHQKRLTPYGPGWVVHEVLNPSTVISERVMANGRVAQKCVNIDLLKSEPASLPSVVSDQSDADYAVDVHPEEQNDDETVIHVTINPLPVNDEVPTEVGGYELRNRAQLRAPPRYRND